MEFKEINKSTIERLSKKSDSSIEDVIEQYIYDNIIKAEDILGELQEISSIEDVNDKEVKFLNIKSQNVDILDKFEYLVSPDKDMYRTNKNIETLRHKYYKIQNLYSVISNELTLAKIENNMVKMEKSDIKLNELETRFEGIGGTVLSIIVSVSIVNTAVVAIDKLESQNVPIFILSIVWFGMTYLLFVNCMFNRKSDNNKNAIALYALVTFIWIISLGLAFRTELIELIEFFFRR